MPKLADPEAAARRRLCRRRLDGRGRRPALRGDQSGHRRDAGRGGRPRRGRRPRRHRGGRARRFPAWARQDRQGSAPRSCARWFDLIMAAQEDLAQLMTAEQGKPLAETRGEVAYGASFIEWFAEEAKRVYGDVIPTHAAGKRILVLKQPIGVVGGDHALELPDRHDHPQGRARRSRPAARWWSSRRTRRRSRRWRWPSWPSAPACRRACSTSSPPRGPRRSARS